MDSSILLPLIGIPIVVAGFALRFNPLLVVTVAGLATGLSVGMDFGMLLETFGEKFVNSRSLATYLLILPVIGRSYDKGIALRLPPGADPALASPAIQAAAGLHTLGRVAVLPVVLFVVFAFLLLVRRNHRPVLVQGAPEPAKS